MRCIFCNKIVWPWQKRPSKGPGKRKPRVHDRCVREGRGMLVYDEVADFKPRLKEYFDIKKQEWCDNNGNRFSVTGYDSENRAFNLEKIKEEKR